MIRKLIVGLVCLAFLWAGVQFVQAQTATTGQIAGNVVDPTGAVVAGAKIALTSDLGVTRESVSDAVGHYSFSLLPPGNYRVEVTAPGFGPLKYENVVVTITNTTVLPVSLKMAKQQETVSVSSTTPLVQTESAQHGKVIEQSEIRQLPLSTRNFQQLLALTAGASGSLQNSSELGRGDAVVFVNGQRAMSNAVVINGVDANAIGTGSTPNLAVPATDAMSEFIVQTSLYDATQGRSAGGAIAAVTKSGTDHFHGNLYEFLRNTSLNANNFFLNRAGVDKPTLDRNQFGGTLGGPVKKNKAWFFVSYQGTREDNGASLLNSLSTVFVPGVLTKDRSDAGLTKLYDSYFPGLGAVYYNLFKNTSQVALLKATAADGNLAIPAASTFTGSTKAIPTALPSMSHFREDQFNANTDLKLSEKNRMSVKFFFANNPTLQGLYSFAGLGNPLQTPGFPTQLDVNQRLFAVDDTHILSANLINYARFGFSQITAKGTPTEPISASSVGISSPLGSLYSGMPTISFYNMMDVGPSAMADQSSLNRSYSAGDMVTWIHGKHTLKFGGEFKRHQSDLIFNAYTRGQMFFTGLTGDPFKDFLMGMPALTVIGSGDPRRNNRAIDLAGYVQDDWRVLPRLTLNLGLRYDYYGPFTESDGRFVGFDPTLLKTATPITGGVQITSGFVQASNGNLPGVAKVEDSIVPADRNNFAPRFGFSWQPMASNRFVVRGGYGIYFDRANARLYNSQVFNSPYYTIGVSSFSATTYPQMSNPFVQVPLPNTYPLNMYANAPGFMPTPLMVFNGTAFVPMTVNTAIPTTGVYPDRSNFRVPYVQQYNLGFQYEFARNWLLDLGYVGSTGRKLYRLQALNQGPRPGWPYPFMAPLYPGMSGLPLPVFGSFLMQSSSNSNYNSLQTTVTKRMGHGLQFLMSYTYSKSMDDYSGTDVSDLSVIPGNEQILNNRALSDFDRRHRVVFTGTYDLPKFYKGQGAAKHVVNNWQMNTIITGQTGVPFTIAGDVGVFAVTRADLKNSTWSPSYCGTGGIDDARLNAYFDTTAFKAPTGAGNFGSTGRNLCRGPAQANVDMSVVKFFTVTETQKIEFRTEFFNLLNNVNFANPVSVSTSNNFGKIVRTSTGPRVIQFAFKYTF